MRKSISFHSMKGKLMKEGRQPNNASIKKNESKHNSLNFPTQDVKMETTLSLSLRNAMPKRNPMGNKNQFYFTKMH